MLGCHPPSAIRYKHVIAECRYWHPHMWRGPPPKKFCTRLNSCLMTIAGTSNSDYWCDTDCRAIGLSDGSIKNYPVVVQIFHYGGHTGIPCFMLIHYICYTAMLDGAAAWINTLYSWTLWFNWHIYIELIQQIFCKNRKFAHMVCTL